MWIFAINGIAYVLYLAVSGEWRLLVPLRRSLRDAIQVTLVDLHLRHGLPAQTKYNGAQRIAYTSVILMGLGSLVTGISIYKPTQFALVHHPAWRIRDGTLGALLADHWALSPSFSFT